MLYLRPVIITLHTITNESHSSLHTKNSFSGSGPLAIVQFSVDLIPVRQSDLPSPQKSADAHEEEGDEFHHGDHAHSQPQPRVSRDVRDEGHQRIRGTLRVALHLKRFEVDMNHESVSLVPVYARLSSDEILVCELATAKLK
ncbi:hypothetical protein PENTCL1PPCAC_29518, partial [Pristionchus entomophagus]